MIPLSNQILAIELQNRVYRINKNQKLNVVKEEHDFKGALSSVSKEIKKKPPVFFFKVFPDTKPSNFKMPTQYICYNGKEAETDTEQVEYDIDGEDTVWLKLANERRKRLKEKQISEELFELAIDKLEKESHFQISIGASDNPVHMPQVDNDAACCICNDADDSNVNQIIFCDMCNIAVHQECYGVPYIPEGQWLCRRCQLSPSVPVKCILCPYSYGAFKQTSDGSWSHVMCALWLNEVHFANTVFNEPIEGTENALRRRSKLRCLVCKQARTGACLQCSKKLCTRAFHVTCAYFAGMHMEVRPENVGNDSGYSRYVYCHKHTPAEKRLSTSEASWKRLINKKIKDARKQVLNIAREAPQISIPVIPQTKIDQIRNDLKLDKTEDICYYWALKRRSRFGVPLIRRLQVYQSQKSLKRQSNECNGAIDDALLTDTDRHVGIITAAFSSTSSVVSVLPTPSTTVGVGGGVIVGGIGDFALTAEQIHVLRMRGNLERVRLLCELVKKREKYKREFITTTESVFDKCMRSLLGATLDGYVSKDCASSTNLSSILDHLKNLALLKDVENINACQAEDTEPLTLMPLLDSNLNSNFIKAKSKTRKADKNVSLFSPPKLFSGLPPATINSAKSNLISRKRKSCNDDFFSSKTSPSLNFGSNSSSFNKKASTSAVFHPLKTPISTASTYRSRKRGSARLQYGYDYLTEVSSASETGLDGYGTTSMDDDDFTDAESLASVTAVQQSIIRRTSSIKMPRRESLLKESKLLLSNRGKRSLNNTTTQRQRRLPTRRICNEFDSTDPNMFAHNDIVWAQLDNDNVIPARVIDLRMRIHLDDFPVDRALQLKPSGNEHTLVVLFDIGKTWKWILTNRLKPCDVTSTVKSPPSSFVHAAQIDGGAALRRARQFWNEMLHE